MQQTEIISGTLSYGNNKINCLRIGKGKKLIIAFHGFGDSAELFVVFKPYLHEDYTIVSIDLPGHGLSQWQDKYMLPEALMALVQGIKNDFAVEQFSLMGFSLGARVALNIVGLQPTWVDRLVLLAPDGLKNNFWYYFSTRNLLGRAVFQQVLNRPQPWIKWFHTMRNLNLIDESRFKFVSSKLMNHSVNEQVAYVWPVMSRLKPNPSVVKHNIKKYKIPVHIYMGIFDRIINYRIGEKFIKGLETAQLSILKSGHNVVKTEYIKQIVEESHLGNREENIEK